jgi:hypothetical protein
MLLWLPITGFLLSVVAGLVPGKVLTQHLITVPGLG